MEVERSLVMTRQDIRIIRNLHRRNLLIDDRIAEFGCIELNDEAVIDTGCDIEDDEHLLFIGTSVRDLRYICIQDLVNGQGEIDSTITSIIVLEHDQIVIHRLVVLDTIDGHVLVRTDGVMTVGILRRRIDGEIERRGGVASRKIGERTHIDGITVKPLSVKLNRRLGTGGVMELGGLRDDIRYDDGIHACTIAGVLCADIDGERDLYRVA